MAQYKYKIRDKVLVRPDLTANVYYDRCLCVPEMERLAGQVVTITRCFNGRHCRYNIAEDRGWSWAYEMFSGLADDLLYADVDEKALLEVLNV